MKLFKHIAPLHGDARGEIMDLLPEPGTVIKSILRITSKAGTVRANHYHKKDSHYCYLLSGKMEYLERPIEDGDVQSVIVEAGDVIYTPPMIVHAMRFLEDSEFYTFATEPRTPTSYEEDLVRVVLAAE